MITIILTDSRYIDYDIVIFETPEFNRLSQAAK